MLEKEVNSFRFLGRHTGPQQWSHTEQKHSHFRPVYHATLDWGRQKRKKKGTSLKRVQSIFPERYQKDHNHVVSAP